MAGYALKIKARYRRDQTSRELLLQAIYTDSGLLVSHLRYLASNSNRSASWMDRSVFSVMLLIRYINVNQDLFTDTTSLLRAFSQCLTQGTINLSTLEDESGLYWSARRIEDARAILGHLTSYTDWLAEQEGYDLQRSNPFRLASSVEQRLNWCAYYHRKGRVFLNHLMDDSAARQRLKFVYQISVPRAPYIDVRSTKRFPESEIRNLLDNGFIKSRAGFDNDGNPIVDYKNQAITLLMHYGGVRKSEIFHLYLRDIHVDRARKEAIVRIYHPSEGASPDKQFNNRRNYLLREFGLKPRTDYMKSERLHLGWKAPLLSNNERFFQVQFFPSEKATEFLMVWKNYLALQRVEPLGNAHPYAFTNSKGCPETLKNFQRLHVDAVRRIGLDHSKKIGTSEHGHRHAYGFRLAEHGLTQLQIQKALHHKSSESCLVYIQPTDEELRERMRSSGL